MRCLHARLALVAVLFAVTASPVAQAAPVGSITARIAKRCRSVHAGGYTIHIHVDRGHTSCRRARKLIRDLYQGRGKEHGDGTTAHTYYSLRGWRCFFSAGTGSCIKHPKTDYEAARDRVAGTTIPPGR